jgi:hypothetical protein
MNTHVVRDWRSNTEVYSGTYRQCQRYIKVMRNGWAGMPPQADAKYLTIAKLNQVVA